MRSADSHDRGLGWYFQAFQGRAWSSWPASLRIFGLQPSDLIAVPIYCPHYCPLPHLPRLSHSPSPKIPSSLRVANALRLDLPTSSLPPFIRRCFYPAPPRLIRPYAPSDKSKSNQKVPNPISKSLRNLSVRSRQIRFPASSFPLLRPPPPPAQIKIRSFLSRPSQCLRSHCQLNVLTRLSRGIQFVNTETRLGDPRLSPSPEPNHSNPEELATQSQRPRTRRGSSGSVSSKQRNLWYMDLEATG